MALDVRLSVLALVATALWMPLGTALVAHAGLLHNPLVLLVLLGCWIGSVMVFYFPFALKVEEQEVEATWVGGRSKRWPRKDLDLALPGSLLNWTFGARQVKFQGKTVAVLWSLMSNYQKALVLLSKEPASGAPVNRRQ